MSHVMMKRAITTTTTVAAAAAATTTATHVSVTRVTASSTRIVVLSMIFWICLSIFGWQYPRSLLRRETDVLTIKPPYQISGLAAPQTIIIDFDLNKSLVDPPTVNDTLLRKTSILWPLLFFVLHAWFANDLSKHRENADEKENDKNNEQHQHQQQQLHLPQMNQLPRSVLMFIYSDKTSNRTLRKIYSVATVVSAFCVAIGISEGSTVMLKRLVQRRRPNFYALCGFDSISKKCTAHPDNILDANFSFPSGHSSLVACGMTFLMLYLHGTYGGLEHTIIRNKSISNDTPVSQSAVEAIAIELVRLLSLLVKTGVPAGWALYVAASRLVDNWHHPSDVVMGLGLGVAAATIAYHHWYPPIWSEHRGIPKSLLQTTRNSAMRSNANANANIKESSKNDGMGSITLVDTAYLEGGDDAGTITTAPSSNSSVLYNLQRRHVQSGLASEDHRPLIPPAPSSLNYIKPNKHSNNYLA